MIKGNRPPLSFHTHIHIEASMIITQQQKVEIVHRVREEANALAKEVGWAIEGNCLLTSISLTVALCEEFKVRAVLQAGSASWPRIDLTKDDGRIMTHFSYMFSDDTKSMMDILIHQKLPEMHCWVGIVDTMEIVDPTTIYLKKQCERLTSMKWLAPEPSDFIWCSPASKDWPDGVVYRPHHAAFQIARMVAASLVDNYDLMRSANASRYN